MPQFAVYRNPRRAAEHAPYLLEVQSDLVPPAMGVVVPLVEPGYFGATARRLNPILRVGGASYVLSPQEIGSLPRRQLGDSVADLSGSRHEIMAALDFLLTGI